VDYATETLFIARRGPRILGGATVEVICGGRGVLVNQLGSLDRSGGGTALAAAVQSWAEDQEASFLVTVPLDLDAATFWARAGLAAMPPLGCSEGHDLAVGHQ
ncbi:unnamed protein product, partial [Effrenium voratum]